MKARINYNQKRNIIIISLIVILLIAATIGTVAFIKGNKNAAAAMGEDNHSTIQNNEDKNNRITTGLANNGNQNDIKINNNTITNSENIEINNLNILENENVIETEEPIIETKEETKTEIKSGTTTETTTGATTGTTTNNNSNVPNREYTQTTVIPGRENVLVEQNTQIGWNPINILAYDTASKLKIYKPNIFGEKTVNKTEAKVGEELIYTIKLTNNGNVDGIVTVTDEIPVGTRIKDPKIEGYNAETNTMVWQNVEVKAGESKELTLTVVIEQNTTETVKNTAKINDEKIPEEPETKVANIQTIKKSEGKHKDGSLATPENPLHELDTITYTLIAKNSGTARGTIKICDTVPEGTTLVANSIKIGSNVYTESELNEGIETTVEAGEEKILTFTVTINPFENEKITIRNADAKQDNTPIPPTDDEVEKEYIAIDVNKEFIDKENADNLRPTEIKVALYKNEKDTEYIDVKTLNEQNNWKESFLNLDKYDLETKELIEYDVKELNIDENYRASYEKKQEENNIKFKITNQLKYENISTEITINKKWVDIENAIHPEVTINLHQNGSKNVFESYTLKDGETSHKFTNLPKYDEKGNEYVYTAEEIEVAGYTSQYSEDTLTITNTIKQETISINGRKTWVAPEGTIYPTIKVNLYKNGELISSIKLENGTTSYSFNNLPKYRTYENGEYELDTNGKVQLNEYTIKEEKVDGYTTSYEGDCNEKIINTIEQKYKTISGTKTWIAPEDTVHPNITITLYRNGEEYKTEILKNGTTSYEFKNLEAYAPDGSIYNYTVEESNLENYTSKKSENGVDFINTIKQEKTSINGTKTWIVPEGLELPTITINLLKDGIKVASKELKEGTTSYSFENLDKYDLVDGHKYIYTVTEENVDGYKSEQIENNFTNTIEQDNTVAVRGNKTWVVPEGTTCPTVTINLLKNGEQFKSTTIENGNTTYEFTGLPKYKTDENGNFILDSKGKVELNIYTLEEAKLDGYTSEKAENGTDFKNTINQEFIAINGEKTWMDPEGEKLEHPEIIINLIKNGNKEDSIKLANGTTKYEFTKLPKYKTGEDGKYILDSNRNVQLNEYNIEEEAVRNYVTSYNGYNITNTFNQDIQGTVEVTTTTTSSTSVKTPLDVVFVLDVSGSMKNDNKDSNMVDAVNSAISTIMKNNKESKVGVVTYGKTSKELLPLGSYTPNNNQNKYLKISNHKISTSVNEHSDNVSVTGGTFTQIGIKTGAEMLTSANTEYKTIVGDKEKTITRTPVIILLSDGNPTYYSADTIPSTDNRSGNGSATTENEAYYTIKTADYYKKQVTSHYYGTTGTKSKFYTIGLNMSGTLSETILNPNNTNVNKCNTDGGKTRNRNVMGKLYDKIIEDGSAGMYSYADKSYVGTMTTSDLENIFNTIITDNSTSTESRKITLEESNNRRVELEGINTSKAFSLVINDKKYNWATAKANGYVKGNDTEGYYVDLNSIAKGGTISISYNK